MEQRGGGLDLAQDAQGLEELVQPEVEEVSEEEQAKAQAQAQSEVE